MMPDCPPSNLDEFELSDYEPSPLPLNLALLISSSCARSLFDIDTMATRDEVVAEKGLPVEKWHSGNEVAEEGAIRR
jgi:hypothetical protein